MLNKVVNDILNYLYELAQLANGLVANQLTHVSWLSIVVIFGAGLLTSLTPCMLSMLPITIGYIGGYEANSRWQGAVQSIWFALGLATTLAGLGILAVLVGQVYGQVGIGLSIIVSAIAIIMGLNLLEALPIALPNIDTSNWISPHLPTGIKSYFLGATFGLVASPCSTPVLATLLAWVANTHDLWLGGIFLLAYAVGYVLPLVVAGTFTASIKKLLELRRWSGWISPVSGVLLVGFGVFSLLSRIDLGGFSG